jgi:hypothetical protein
MTCLMSATAPARPMQSSAIDGAVMVALRRLAALDRRPAGAGELAAARLLCAQLQARGARAWIEEAPVHGTYWMPVGLLSGAAALAGLGGRRRALGTGALSAALMADELELGARPLRRFARWRTAHNVIAELGRPSASRTLVIHAHHDAAPTGLVFHPAIARALTRVAGPLCEAHSGTPAPMWTVLAGPALVAAGGALGNRRLRRLGALLSAGSAAAMANIALSPTVPGANDNLSGVGVLLELADELVRRPPEHLRVLLLCTGSEESFVEAMERFGERHFERLPRDQTTFLCLESVGSPTLMLLSGEGLLRAHRYPQQLIETLGKLAESAGVPLHAPFRYRLATDGQVPLRAGYETAVISSIGPHEAPSNYHWPTDTTDRLDVDSIGGAARLAAALVRHLDAR